MQISVKESKINIVALSSLVTIETHIDIANKSTETRCKAMEIVPSVSDVEISSHTSASSPKHQVKRKSIY